MATHAQRPNFLLLSFFCYMNIWRESSLSLSQHQRSLYFDNSAHTFNPKIECKLLNATYQRIQNHNRMEEHLETIDIVQNHYMTLPYPPFTIEDLSEEKNYYRSSRRANSKLFAFMIQLEYINHYLFEGKQTYMNDFRVLMAGGGTGSTTVVLAEQLNHTKSEMVYLDFSASSMKVAQSRAKVRYLQNIVWVTEAIENVHRLNLAKFDFMQCSGVLHHLKSPIKGLKVLKDYLQQKGGIDLMVYGTYGRIGVYHVQEILRMINLQTNHILDELKVANFTLASLPTTNWFKMQDDKISDHLQGDAGIYDLLLHKRDVSYTVLTLMNWIDSSGLFKVRYTSTDYPPLSGDNENPKAYGIKHYKRAFGKNNPKLIQLQMQKIGEAFDSNVMMQNVFVSLNKDSEANISNKENILYVPGDGKCPSGLQRSVRSINPNKKYFSMNVTEYARGTTFSTRWPINSISKEVLNIFIRSECRIELKTFYTTFKKQTRQNLTEDYILQDLIPLYTYANNAGMVLLKSTHIPRFPKSNSPNFIIQKST